MGYCFCTLALGEEYRRVANVFLTSYLRNIPPTGPDVIVVSDDIDDLVKGEKIIPIQIDKKVMDFLSDGRGQPMERYFISLKWLAFEEAYKLGYRDNICFIDVDSLVSENWSDGFLDSIETGIGGNWVLSYNNDVDTWRHHRAGGSEKLAFLLEDYDEFPISCPIESVMFLRESEEKVGRFIYEWKNAWEKIVRNGLYHRMVCHEIGLAASRASVSVYTYEFGRRTFFDKSFRHYGMRGTGQMLKDWDTVMEKSG